MISSRKRHLYIKKVIYETNYFPILCQLLKFFSNKKKQFKLGPVHFFILLRVGDGDDEMDGA